jgi:hypothetical protein
MVVERFLLCGLLRLFGLYHRLQYDWLHHERMLLRRA